MVDADESLHVVSIAFSDTWSTRFARFFLLLFSAPSLFAWSLACRPPRRYRYTIPPTNSNVPSVTRTTMSPADDVLGDLGGITGGGPGGMYRSSFRKIEPHVALPYRNENSSSAVVMLEGYGRRTSRPAESRILIVSNVRPGTSGKIPRHHWPANVPFSRVANTSS